jgi:hypothetical protein
VDDTRRQNLIAIVVTGFVLVAMAAALLLGGRSGGGRASSTSAPPTENQSSDRTDSNPPAKPANKQSPSGSFSAEGETDEGAKQIQPATSRSADSLPEAVAELIQVAVNNRETGAFITRLEDYLRSDQTVAAAAEVYQALGTLHLRKSPPSVDSAIACFQEAAARAESPALRDEARLSGVRLLLAEGRGEEAAAMLQGHASGDAQWTPAALQLDILAARQKESGQEWDAAEAIYESILSRVEADSRLVDPESEATYRQACVYLSRIYQRSGRGADAEDLAQRVKLRAEGPTAGATK